MSLRSDGTCNGCHDKQGTYCTGNHGENFRKLKKVTKVRLSNLKHRMVSARNNGIQEFDMSESVSGQVQANRLLPS